MTSKPAEINREPCTAEAKLCPNGSYVVRDYGKNCQYKACDNTLPNPQEKPKNIELPGTLRYDPKANYDGVDYTISLEFITELIDTTSARGESTPVKSLPIVPINSELRKDLMGKVNQKVVVTGFVEWGLAEGKHLKVESVR